MRTRGHPHREFTSTLTSLEYMPPDELGRTAEEVDLMSLGPAELVALVRRWGQPAYRGRQIFRWIHRRGASSFQAMTDLPKPFREQLTKRAKLDRLEPIRFQASADGTTKALFSLPSGRRFEAVLIPDVAPDGTARRLTVCVSSQVGCAMGCTFCATGLMGFQENLTAGHICDQVRVMNERAMECYGRKISNVVYMGMGEPLLNYGAVLQSIHLLTNPAGPALAPRRITVSTVGLARRIRQLAEDDPGVHLAVSLHAPTDAQRSAIMPVSRTASTDLSALREAIEHYHRQTGRGVTYEYCLFHQRNDSPEDAQRLAHITRWVPSKVNLIMYNPVAGLSLKRTPEDRLHAFIRELVHRCVVVTVRQSRGQDIDAACGQLATR